MSLACGYCDSDFDWYYTPSDEYIEFVKPRGKRCVSCNDLIRKGDTCIEFECYRYPRDDIEERIHGEGGEIPLADKYLCEKCADLYLSLHELGFTCISISDHMPTMAKLYAEEYQ